jgi:dihydrofolate reductase
VEGVSMPEPEYLAWLGENPDGDHLVLMGANTYRLMYGFTKEGEPGTDVLTGMPKVVFSSTLTEPLEWENSTLVGGDATEAVRKMKDDGYPDIALDMTDSRTFDGQIQLVECVPRVLDGPPGIS